MRERNAVKAVRSVLRGGMGSNAYSLPDCLPPNIEEKYFLTKKEKRYEILSGLYVSGKEWKS